MQHAVCEAAEEQAAGEGLILCVGHGGDEFERRTEGVCKRLRRAARQRPHVIDRTLHADGLASGCGQTRQLVRAEQDQRLVLTEIRVNGGQEPGTRFHFHNDDIMTHFQDKLSAHEVGIQDVLALLTVTGRKIPEVVVLGAQPYDLEAGVELSPEMKALLPLVAQEAIDVLKEWGIEVKEKAEERSLDYGVVAEECVREEMK